MDKVPLIIFAVIAILMLYSAYALYGSNEERNYRQSFLYSYGAHMTYALIILVLIGVVMIVM